MKSREPMLICDGDDGDCWAESRDYYASFASTVGGVAINAERRAPGWTSVDDLDFCPLHCNGVAS